MVEPKYLLLGVTEPDGHYVPAAPSVITRRKPHAFKNLNAGVVHVNVHLADGYNANFFSTRLLLKTTEQLPPHSYQAISTIREDYSVT